LKLISRKIESKDFFLFFPELPLMAEQRFNECVFINLKVIFYVIYCVFEDGHSVGLAFCFQSCPSRVLSVMYMSFGVGHQAEDPSGSIGKACDRRN